MSLNSRSCTYCIEDVHKFVILVHGSDGVFLHAALENVHTYPLTDHWHLQERPVGQCKAKNFKGVYDTTLEFLEALGGGGEGRVQTNKSYMGIESMDISWNITSYSVTNLRGCGAE